MKILSNVNDKKATAGNLRPEIVKLGGNQGHEIIIKIIKQIWDEREYP